MPQRSFAVKTVTVQHIMIGISTNV